MQKHHSNIPASYLVLFKENKVLLLKRANTGFGDGKYSVIAGHVEKGENFTDCIIREAKEEAGITLKKEDLKVVHIMHRKTTLQVENERVDTFFTATKWGGEIINMEPHKCDDLSFFELNNLPKNIIEYIKLVIEDIQNGIYYSEYGWE